MLDVACLKNLSDQELVSTRVLVRVDFNVPIQDGHITDDTRIRAALKTIQYLTSKQARVVLISHLGRPKGVRNESYSLKIVADYLTSLINQDVLFVTDCIGSRVSNVINSMSNGQVALLENVRFYPQEEANNQEFAKQLSLNADIFVQEAFGTVHRAHASTHAITQILPSYAGFLLEHELSVVSGLMNSEKKPVLAIVGGSKVSSKLKIIKNLISFVDVLLIGGAMAYTFLKAQEIEVGKSLVEDDLILEALAILSTAKENNVELCLPTDHVVASSLDDTNIVESRDIAQNKMGLDIGPETRKKYVSKCLSAGMILWNGPMGVFEQSAYSEGTRVLSQAVCNSSAFTVVGGGDSVAALSTFGGANMIDHISTGGGAFLSVLEGNVLPGVKGLSHL